MADLTQNVTLTFGVAAFSGNRSLDDCLKSADGALYAGNAAGRNRVVGVTPVDSRVNPTV